MSEPADDVTVVPSPKLSPVEYLRGIPATGVRLSREEAEPLLAAGLVVEYAEATPGTVKRAEPKPAAKEGR